MRGLRGIPQGNLSYFNYSTLKSREKALFNGWTPFFFLLLVIGGDTLLDERALEMGLGSPSQEVSLLLISWYKWKAIDMPYDSAIICITLYIISEDSENLVRSWMYFLWKFKRKETKVEKWLERLDNYYCRTLWSSEMKKVVALKKPIFQEFCQILLKFSSISHDDTSGKFFH